MSPADPRLTLARDGIAARALEGVAAAERYLDPAPMSVRASAAALRAAPDGLAEQKTQLLFGEGFDVLDLAAGWVFGQARRDGYVGWVEAAALSPDAPVPTHRVSALGSVALARPDARGPARMVLSLNALVRIEAREGRFALAAGAGWVPDAHLAQLGQFEADPAALAVRHLGTAYLWGGRDRSGVDCSGLVQQALFACGMGCPRDSDQQARLGRPVGPEALGRNDLVGWAGHIGIMVDAERIVHACGRRMAVVVETLTAAVAARMDEIGPPSAFRRLTRP